jgi:hypothetical protein
MKAIKIDVKNRQVVEVEINPKNVLKDWYNQIGCNMVETAIRINETDSILVDESGILNMEDDSMFFTYDGYRPFIGNGLIVGCNYEGDSVSCKISVDDVIDKVEFYNMDEMYRIASSGNNPFKI